MTVVDSVVKRMASFRPRPSAFEKRIAVTTSPVWDPVQVWWFRRTHGYNGHVPRFANRKRVGAWPVAAFINGGRQARDALAERMVTYSRRPLGELSVLDLACGVGRIALHFEGQFGRFCATDVDASAITYLQRKLPHLDATCNRSEPPLPFSDAVFDVVYSWSLWTHLPLDLQEAWLTELHRVLKPGGYAFLTVNGHVWLDAYQQGPSVEPFWLTVTHEDLRSQGMLYRKYELDPADVAPTLPGIKGSYGLAFHDPDYIRRSWGALFTVEEVDEGGMHNHQDLVVLRRS